MISSLRPDDCVRLPGPSQFIRRVAADLAVGKSAVVVFPDSIVDSGIADAVLEDLSREGVRADFCDESADPFPARILTTFGADPLRESDYAEWDRIIDWEPWHGSWVFVPTWQHNDVEEIIDRWPAQLNACGLSLEDRPKLIVAVRLTDLPRAKTTHLDLGAVTVHWWWGVFDRLDSELRLAAVAGRTLNPVQSAVIVEVSGWDLSCIEFLAREWDRTSSGLPRALHDYKAIAATEHDHAPSLGQSARRGLTAPPTELEQAWRRGLVDRWEHGVRRAPYAICETDVAQRLWMAHNRVLTQYVDEERAEYEQMILSKRSPVALKDLRQRDDDIVEIGSLAWLVDTGRVDIAPEHRDRLRTFRDLRNELAHRKPIGDELLRRATGYLEF